MSNMKPPGVYIEEINDFPNSVAPVATAIPAFIGYTPQATYEGKSCTNVAMRISSFHEFLRIYGYPDAIPPAEPKKQYCPHYYLVEQPAQSDLGDYIEIYGKFYAIIPDPSTIYYLYNSLKLFFSNGGGNAYIVSVGAYGTPSVGPAVFGNQIVNPNVKLNDLLHGLGVLKDEQEPTMYICPEATLLSVDDNGTLMKSMLLQNADMQTAISIFDIIGSNTPDPILWLNDIETFRSNTGTVGLDYGVAYYPSIGTNITRSQDIDYTNVFGGDLDALEILLNPANHPNPAVDIILNDIRDSCRASLTIAQYDTALRTASPIYSAIIEQILEQANVLPPSGAMAGVITSTDQNRGVWTAPANRSIIGAVNLPLHITSREQEGLNIDAVSGKSINAIRSFPGKGILVWGARTLDGNSNDWRYISVRRTLIFIKQSCKLATQAFVFEPNTRNTWISVKAMISNFLTNIWRSGGLAGPTADNAFFVHCGLGETMTANDIAEGFMIVEIGVAVIRPAEFIIIKFQQKMAKSS